MKKTLLSLLMTASSCAAFAQWTQLPAQGGEIRDLMTVPSGILLATEGGVFKSTDGGNTWAYSSNGLYAADSAISCTQFAKTATAIFVNGNNGIAKSTNDGASWVSAGNAGLTGGMGNFSGVVAQGNKLYTCKYTNMSNYTLFMSNDDGATWTSGASFYVNGNSPRLFSIGGTVYVTKRDTVYSTSTGTALTVINNGLPLTGSQIGLLSSDGTYLYGGLENGGGGYYRYDISGGSWQSIMSGLPPAPFTSGPYLIGTTLYGSVLTMSMTLQTYTSTNQGTSWGQTSLSGLSADFVNQMYPLGGSNILVNNPIDGINLSSNNGATWTPHQTGFKAVSFRDRRNIAFANGNLLQTKDLGISRSTDGGMTWVSSMNGMPTTLLIDFGLYKAGGNTVYSSFMDIGGKYLYKSTDGGLNWASVTYPAPGEDINYWSRSNTAVFVTANHVLYRSTDGGTSWTNINSNLPGGYNYDLPMVNDPNTNTLYIVGRNGSNYQISYSTDDGTSWNFCSMSGLPVNSYLGDNLFMHGNALMSAWVDYSTFPATYKMSTWNTGTWSTITINGLPPNVINSCSGCNGGSYNAQWYSNNGVLFYMTNKGLFTSGDNGATFTAYNNGLYPGVNPSRLTNDGTSLYAATEGNSIWKISLPTSLNTYTKAESLFDAYPNPAIDYVTISFSKDVVDATSKVVVTNMLGATVLETTVPAGANHMEVSTANLKAGVYFYSVTSSSKKSVAKKLVINK